MYFCSEPIKFYENYTNLTAGWFQVRACNLTEISASKSTSANSEFWGSSKISFLPFYTFFHNPPYIQGFLGLKKCAIRHWLLLYIFDCVFNIFWDIMWKIQNLKQFAMDFVAAILIFNFVKKFSKSPKDRKSLDDEIQNWV